MHRSHSRSPPVPSRDHRDRGRAFRERDRDRRRRDRDVREDRRDRDNRDDRRDFREDRRDLREDKRDRDRDIRDDRKDRDRDRDSRGDKEENKYASRRRSRSPIVRRESRRSYEGGNNASISGSGVGNRASGSNQTRNAVPDFLMERQPLKDEDLVDKNEEEIEMMKLMGFGGFETTKGKKVPGNNVSGVHVIQKRKYRQYMNRKGGFNRPLDFVA